MRKKKKGLGIVYGMWKLTRSCMDWSLPYWLTSTAYDNIRAQSKDSDEATA